jgi:hypothetical protein
MGLPRRVGLVVVPVVRTLVALVPRALAQAPAVPRTGFERPRVDRIAETAQGRPVHLVRLGSPTPRPMERAARGRVVLFVPTANPDGS